MTFGEKIQILRKQAGLSQENLAEKLNITRQTVSKWELDQSTPELEYIAKLADLYNVTTDYLIRENADSFGAGDISEADTEADSMNAEMLEVRKESSAPSIALGIILTVMGMIGILIFITLSVVHPWSVTNEIGTFEGLIGYLLGTKTVLYFMLSVVLVISGISVLAVLSLKQKFKSKHHS